MYDKASLSAAADKKHTRFAKDPKCDGLGMESDFVGCMPFYHDRRF